MHRTDYRHSHVEPQHAARYHAAFATNAYRSAIWALEQQRITTILAQRNLGRSASYLDFACGTGRVSAFLSTKLGTGVGVDVSGAMLEVARQNWPHLEWVQADLTRDESVLASRTFDVITAFRFFPNAQPELREQVLKVVTERLTPNGILIWNNHLNSGSLLRRLLRFVRRRDPHAGMSMSEGRRLMASAGFIIEEEHSLGLLPITENRNPLPEPVVRTLERLFHRLPLPSGLYQNTIVVARKR